MEEQINNQRKKSGFSKRIIAIIIIALVVVGGSAAAYIALTSSTKTKYFLAEKATIDFTFDEINDRFEPELKWAEYANHNAIGSTLALTGQLNDPSSENSFELFSPEQIINNASLTIKTKSDLKNKKMAAEVIAHVAGMEIDNILFYLTEQQFMLGLPFLEDMLLVNNKDLSTMLQKIDPELAAIDFDFADLFDTQNPIFSEKDKKHFETEYLYMIHSELSGDAFTSKDETVTINGESIKAEKMTMHLTEKEVKDLLSKLLDKLRQDERVKELIKDQFGATAFIDEDINELITDFENGLLDMKEELQSVAIPDGLTSTIWVDKKLIVKRDFSISVGPTQDDLVTLTVAGEQLLQSKNQSFAYVFGFKDSYDQAALSLVGDLSQKDGQITDSIKLLVDETELAYAANETLKNGQREFERVFSMVDPYSINGSFNWSGNATYEKDRMNSEHTLALTVDELGNDFLTLELAIDGQKIKTVDIPDGDNIKDIGIMSEAELSDYLEQDASVQFQQWIMRLLGGGLLGL